MRVSITKFYTQERVKGQGKEKLYIHITLNELNELRQVGKESNCHCTLIRKHGSGKVDIESISWAAVLPTRKYSAESKFMESLR